MAQNPLFLANVGRFWTLCEPSSLHGHQTGGLDFEITRPTLLWPGYIVYRHMSRWICSIHSRFLQHMTVF